MEHAQFDARAKALAALAAREMPTMGAGHFDRLTQVLASTGSRRQALVGTLAVVLGTLDQNTAGAKKKKPCPPCKKRKKGKCKGKVPDGTPCASGTCQSGACVAQPIGASCSLSSPESCSSGVCGCIGDTNCTCRKSTCVPSYFQPCAVVADCCSNACVDTQIFGRLCV